MNYRIIPFILIVLSGTLLCTNKVYAQKASSLCVITKVGTPETSPSLPPGCGAVSGNYQNPLFKPEDSDPKQKGTAISDHITGIFTEMGTYGDPPYVDPDTGVPHNEHAGLDIGTPDDGQGNVYAITDGEVTEVGGSFEECTNRDYGCSVSIKHSTDSLISRYTHIDTTLSLNASVKRGDKIGRVHKWLSYDNDHLHFELKLQENNNNINPRNYFPELEQFPLASAYGGDIRSHTAKFDIFMSESGGLWPETFKDHPPCPPGSSSFTNCWAL